MLLLPKEENIPSQQASWPLLKYPTSLAVQTEVVKTVSRNSYKLESVRRICISLSLLPPSLLPRPGSFMDLICHGSHDSGSSIITQNLERRSVSIARIIGKSSLYCPKSAEGMPISFSFLPLPLSPNSPSHIECVTVQVT